MQAGTKREHIEIKIEVVPCRSTAGPEQNVNPESAEKVNKNDEGRASEDATGTEGSSQPGPTAGPSPVPPFLVHFASNDVKHDDQYQLEVYKPKDPEKQQPLIIMCKQSGANLIGTTALPSQTAADKAYYCVGLYNKTKRTLTLTAAAGNTVVKMEPQAAFMKDAEVAGFTMPESRQDQQELMDAAARRSAAKRLVEVFGSTRRRRQMEQIEEAKVVVDKNADLKRLAMIMGKVAAKAAATEQTTEQVMSRVRASLLPAHNPKATRPDDAYNVTAMFPTQLMSALNVEQLLHAAVNQADLKDLKDQSKVPDYIIGRLGLLAADPAMSDADRRKKARHLALLSALMQLAAASPKLMLGPPKLAPDGGRARPGGLDDLALMLSKQVLEPLLDKFYEESMVGGYAAYVRDKIRYHLLVMHILVVALDVEGWAMAPQQFDALRELLKMSPADLVHRFRGLGCRDTKFTTGDQTSVTSYTVTLLADGVQTLEQSFPQLPQGPRKRRKI